jgi:hypothetical protein
LYGLVGLEGLFEYWKIVKYQVLISFWDLVICDGTIVGLVAGYIMVSQGIKSESRELAVG